MGECPNIRQCAFAPVLLARSPFRATAAVLRSGQAGAAGSQPMQLGWAAASNV